MKLEKKQRFSIRKYAIGAASVLIGFAFGTQVVSADSVTPTPENPSAAQTAQGEPQTAETSVESKLKKQSRQKKLQLHSLQQSKKLNPQQLQRKLTRLQSLKKLLLFQKKTQTQ